MAVLTFDEAYEYLNSAADEIPDDLMKGLNGGIVLLPGLERSPHGDNLFILGRYYNEPYGMGRYINVYYGSFRRVYGRDSVEAQKEGLKKVLHHELTHHIESLSGVRDLEIKDAEYIAEYKKEQEGP